MGEHHRFPALATRNRHRSRHRPRSLVSRPVTRSYTAPTALSLNDTRSVITTATEHDFFDPPELPDVSELLNRGIPTRLELADMISRTSVEDVQRLPAIHPYVASSRGEKLIRYMTFVSRSSLEWKLPRNRPRTMAVIPRLLGPESCIRCQLRTEHTKCEKHKYLRVGGGFRHSYWYIRKVLEAIEKKQNTGVDEIKQRIPRDREREAAILRAKAEARAKTEKMASKGIVKKRRIKIYIRTITGEVVSQYHFVTERDYNDMKKNKKNARTLLGLTADEKLEDWKSSKQIYEESDNGGIIQVKRKKQKGNKPNEVADPRKTFRNFEGVESGIGRNIGQDEESRISQHTLQSKHVNWEDISQMLKTTENSKGGETKYKTGENVVSDEKGDISPWHDAKNSSKQENDGNKSANQSSHQKGKRQKERRHHGRRHKRLSDGKHGRRSKRKDRKSKMFPRNGSWSPVYGSDHFRGEGKRKGKKRQKRRTKKWSNDPDSDSFEAATRPRRKHKLNPLTSGSKGSDSSSSADSLSEASDSYGTGSSTSYESGSDSSATSTSTESESSFESSTSYTSTSSTSSESQKSSSEVSDVSSPSSVSTGDVSEIASDINEEERRIEIAKKKQDRTLIKRKEKKEWKIEIRKVERESKREVKKQEQIEQTEQKQKQKKGHNEFIRQERIQRQDWRKESSTSTFDDSPVSISDCSISSVDSEDVSDVDDTLAGEDKKKAIAVKKERVKAKKRENKMVMKKERKKQQQQEPKIEQRREEENKRIKRSIAKELERLSSASSASSVRSSELSDLSGLEEVQNEEEKEKIKDEKKLEKKAEKKLEKLFQKAVTKVFKKRNKNKLAEEKEDEQSDYNDNISESGFSQATRRRKQFKHLVPKEDLKTMVKYAKGSKRGLTDLIRKTDGRGMEWFDEWQKKREHERLERERLEKAHLSDDELNLLKSTKDNPESTKTKLSSVTKRKMKSFDQGDVENQAGDQETISSVTESTPLPGDEHKQDGLLQTSLANEVWTGFACTSSTTSEIGESDLQRTSFRGIRKVNTLFKGNPHMQSHLKVVLQTASELDKDKSVASCERHPSNSKLNEVKHTSIDFLSHFRLIEPPKLDPFGKAFVVEDEDRDCCLYYEEMWNALDGVQSLSDIKHKQAEYVLKVLGIDEHSKITFKMFAVVAAICERICSMDPFGKYLIDKSDLLDIERKMSLYKSMFYCNVNSERSDNHITTESLRIELVAGGLNREQGQYVLSRMRPNDYSEISFFDYMAYIPLFLSMHDNIIDNPLDMTEKYNMNNRKVSVRDMNPLGLPLRREFLDAPKDINPSGIPLGKPMLQTKEEFRSNIIELEGADPSAGASRPPSERLPSVSSKPSSWRSSSTTSSARSRISESPP